ncbi:MULTISPECIES: cytochrome P450 [Streptomyces]|uniref:cytochrome P450 n=1 Tax=Streptomyces TaxID=1883 RepID=UPI001D0BCE07|nr:cytochrome P450 [Streptomyces longhuiensis]UDL97067.1 cytochrome P450 [Streptomyces longhuiensis]
MQLTETLRRDPPVRTLRRIAVCDIRIDGRDIAEGDLVLLETAASDAGGVVEPLAFGGTAADLSRARAGAGPGILMQ